MSSEADIRPSPHIGRRRYAARERLSVFEPTGKVEAEATGMPWVKGILLQR